MHYDNNYWYPFLQCQFEIDFIGLVVWLVIIQIKDGRYAVIQMVQ